MTLIRTNTRSDVVKRQKAIIDYVHQHQDRHGSDPKMTEAIRDYDKLSAKIRK